MWQLKNKIFYNTKKMFQFQTYILIFFITAEISASTVKNDNCDSEAQFSETYERAYILNSMFMNFSNMPENEKLEKISQEIAKFRSSFSMKEWDIAPSVDTLSKSFIKMVHNKEIPLLISYLFETYVMQKKGLLCKDFDVSSYYPSWKKLIQQNSNELGIIIKTMNDPYLILDIIPDNLSIDKNYANTLSENIIGYLNEEDTITETKNSSNKNKVIDWMLGILMTEDGLKINEILQNKNSLSEWINAHDDIHSIFFSTVKIKDLKEYLQLIKDFNEVFPLNIAQAE